MINKIKTIGIVGGGQLGRMMIPYIKQLGLNVAILDPAKNAPCSSICDYHIVADFNDPKGFAELAQRSDVITYEFEHINADLLETIEKQGKPVYPSVKSLRIIQDKYTQKQALRESGIAVGEFQAVSSIDDLFAHPLPFMLKSRTGGYDGKGNYLVKSKDDIEEAYRQLSGGGKHALMIEAFVDFEKEVSVIATRGKDGECVIFPIAENVHKNSILDTTSVPANINEKTTQKVMEVAKSVMECFQGVGTFCAELFVNEKTGEVLVNEVAPRVHNSGHYTIEACRTSQFENHIRAIIGVGLGSTEMLVECAVMRNIIGNTGGKAGYKGIEEALKFKNVNVHIYGKPDVAVGRKMGHFTITGSVGEVKKKLAQINIETIGE